MNIYEQVLANIDADPKAWCQGEWTLEDEGGKPVSRCLVEHIDFATGVSYVKPNGRRFVSKDVRKWNRRNAVLANLASLLPASHRPVEDVEVAVVNKRQVEEAIRYGYERPTGNYHETKLVMWNDEDTDFTRGDGTKVTKTTKAKVRNLLKRAAKRFPED